MWHCRLFGCAQPVMPGFTLWRGIVPRTGLRYNASKPRLLPKAAPQRRR